MASSNSAAVHPIPPHQPNTTSKHTPGKFGIISDKQHRVDPITISATSNFHTHQQSSYLSSDSAHHDFRGLVNLGAIILVAMNARLVVENLRKYGILINPATWYHHIITHWNSIWPSVIVASYIMLIAPLLSLIIEISASKHTISNPSADKLHITHILLIFTLPQIFIWCTQPTFLTAVALLICTLIYSLKLTSYAHVSHQLRIDAQSIAANKKSDNNVSVDPNNLTDAGDELLYSHITGTVYKPTWYQLFYFTLAPTLIYQTQYPRSERIRIRFCIRRLLEIIICLSLQLLLVEQYIIPTVRNTVPYMHKYDSQSNLILVERVLKLAIPNALAWLLMFYSVFHSTLNLLAELLRFADRQFYNEWWNSQDLV